MPEVGVHRFISSFAKILAPLLFTIHLKSSKSNERRCFLGRDGCQGNNWERSCA